MTHWNSPEFGNRYIFETVFGKCKTVEEAINFISQYFFPFLKFSHVLIADATGDAVIVEWGNNKLSFIRKDNYS